MSLLVPTHALPPLSYRIPESLRTQVKVGATVVAPLSGRHRLGVVVGVAGKGDNAREDVLSVVPSLSLQPELVEICQKISDNAAIPLPAVLRAALPPGIETGNYRMREPLENWPGEVGANASRAALKRALGPDGLRAAEAEGRILLDPSAPQPATVEWAVVRAAADPDLSRAPRQRELFDAIDERGGSWATSSLLSETGASRSALRELVRRGAVRLERRAEPAPLLATDGDDGAQGLPFLHAARRALQRRGGAYVWRTSGREERDAVAAVVDATLRRGNQALVLAPEIRSVERLVDSLRRLLPPGHTVTAYHGGLGRERAAIHAAARSGAVDVVVGTRTAALLGLARPGSICVVDEPNEAHRADPGHEGLQVHVRDVALVRARVEHAAVFFLSPHPSLRLYADEVRRQERIRELPPSRPGSWPAVRIVDMRGSGAMLSSTLIEACRRNMEDGGKTGIILKRLGYATAVSCNHCGEIGRCPNCDAPLVLQGKRGSLLCTRCGHKEKQGPCTRCGWDRVQPTGLGVERVRHELSDILDAPVGLSTAEKQDQPDAPIVVGTAPRILDREWDVVVLPDADAFLASGAVGAVEKSFRLFYGAAEAARGLLLVQTRLPEHYALRAGVRGDYGAFASAELPRLRSHAYPPFGHVASLTFRGSRAAVSHAVESRLRPALEPGVEMSPPVPLRNGGEGPAWRVLLRSRGLSAVARTAAWAARAVARTHGLSVRVEVDPEEV